MSCSAGLSPFFASEEHIFYSQDIFDLYRITFFERQRSIRIHKTFDILPCVLNVHYGFIKRDHAKSLFFLLSFPFCFQKLHLYDLVHIFFDFGRLKFPDFPAGKFDHSHLDGRSIENPSAVLWSASSPSMIAPCRSISSLYFVLENFHSLVALNQLPRSFCDSSNAPLGSVSKKTRPLSSTPANSSRSTKVLHPLLGYTIA